MISFLPLLLLLIYFSRKPTVFIQKSLNLNSAFFFPSNDEHLDTLLLVCDFFVTLVLVKISVFETDKKTHCFFGRETLQKNLKKHFFDHFWPQLRSASEHFEQVFLTVNLEALNFVVSFQKILDHPSLALRFSISNIFRLVDFAVLKYC